MVSKEDLVMTKHAQDEANDDGISRTEIAEAITQGPRFKEGDHFITIYRDFCVIFEPLEESRFKVITVHWGKPKNWRSKQP